MNYVKKCPVCGSDLSFVDVDYRFEGCQDEWSMCEHCHLDFEFYIRYHKLVRYAQYSMYLSSDGSWETDSTTIPKIVRVGD